MAERQGLRLQKSRRRDICALDYGRYWLMRGSHRSIVEFGGDTLATIDKIEAYLTCGDG